MCLRALFKAILAYYSYSCIFACCQCINAWYNTSMNSLRKKHLCFIEHLKEKTALSITAIAHAANIADSTLTRFVSKDDFPRLSTATLDKIAKVGAYNSYEDYLIKNHVSKEAENNSDFSDAEKYETYDMVKNLIIKLDGAAKPSNVTFITEQTLETARKLGTRFITESLIMYVLESGKKSN